MFWRKPGLKLIPGGAYSCVLSRTSNLFSVSIFAMLCCVPPCNTPPRSDGGSSIAFARHIISGGRKRLGPSRIVITLYQGRPPTTCDRRVTRVVRHRPYHTCGKITTWCLIPWHNYHTGDKIAHPLVRMPPRL